MTKELLQNEVVGIEKLEKVSGGDIYETSYDSEFLNWLGGYTNIYSTTDILFRHPLDEIRAGWAKVGVEAEIRGGSHSCFGSFDYSPGASNVYKIDGRVVSRDAAIRHAIEVSGKQVDWDEW